MSSVSAQVSESLPLPAGRRFRDWVFSRPGAAFGYGLAVAAIYWGWLNSDASTLSADEGLGYALGIAGGSMMLLLLLYSARKRVKLLRRLGATRYWFRIHMQLGIVGPVLILYHCNFNIGSLNSQVALYCTLMVAGSGVLGRYLYAQIHHGLYGRKASLRELTTRLNDSSQRLANGDGFMDDIRQQLVVLGNAVMEPPASLLEGVWRPIVTAVQTRWLRVRLSWLLRKRLTARAMTSPAVAEHRDRLLEASERFIAEHLAQVRRVAQFGFYERLFSLWHVVHVPVFLMMVFSALVHVLAVHMY
jgi:hypothetical protein